MKDEKTMMMKNGDTMGMNGIVASQGQEHLK
jgi:hypothetical protein